MALRMALPSGTHLGGYEIVALLGAGGMGEAYRARDTRLHRDVALKVLPPAMAGDPMAFALFEREAQAVAALSHPHILAVHDSRQCAVHGDRFLALRPSRDSTPQAIAVIGNWSSLLPRSVAPPQ